jgi:ABC-type Fe3+/spermidine/putrescine transport system ATPase subunit
MLSVQNLTKKYDEFLLDDISLEIGQGEYFVLLGPSGAGKTILFETIAGIISPNSGKIIFDEKDITNEPIRKRQIGLVLQDGAVFPHMTAGQNISYPLKVKGWPALKVKEKVFQLAEQMSISHLLHRKPSTLSGGELRRIAIARTLALDPKCLLLDEPLSSLDIQLQQEILDLLKNLNQSGLTILHITHNYHEAFYVAQRMAVMDKGRIIQQGTPAEITNHPKSKFVADFIGIGNYIGGMKV